jgi:twitching motility protein PilT
MEDFPEAPIATELPPPQSREAHPNREPHREPHRYREPIPAPPHTPPVKPSSLIPQALAALALKAAECGASDLHLTLGEVPTVRVERRLRPLPDAEPFEESRLIEDQLPPDASSVDLAFDTPSGQRLRVHAFRYEHGVGAAIRLMPGSPRPLSRLGLPVALDDLARLSHGLVLIGGPAGSGKTTTMLALTREVLRVRGGVCITLESPIEIPLEAPSATAIVRQRLVGRDVPDMATGLREALREDPDLLVLGELRDPEAILLALSAAETGHLVFATMHCRSAPSAVERVLDAVPPARQAQARGQLAESLRAVVVQRLLPRTDGAGFAIAVEVMRGTRAVASLIRDGKTGQLSSAVQTGAAEGMQPLERTLAQLVEQGKISREAALAACNDTDSMRRMFV